MADKVRAQNPVQWAAVVSGASRGNRRKMAHDWGKRPEIGQNKWGA